MDGELLYADALAWARARRVVLPSEYYGPLGAQARARAFSIAGMGQLDALQGVLDSLGAAVAKGQTFAQWRAALLDDPATLRAAALAPHRLDNIFRTNIQGAYGAGIARQQEAPGALRRRPFFQYDAINDSRTRPAHAAMDNYVAPAGDAVWQRWTPPCGYRCRCVRVALTEAEARARGWKGVTHAPPAEPDEGWGYHPLHGWDAALAQARAHKLASVDPVLARGAGSMAEMQTPQKLNLPTVKGLKAGGYAEAAPPAQDRAATLEDALLRLRATLGVPVGGSRGVETPDGVVTIADAYLPHIVEKRSDARERYGHLIVPTLERPTEIWLSRYGDGDWRKRYIKLFAGPKYDLLVVVKVTQNGETLWNAIPMEPSSIEKQRIGELLWKSHG